MTPTISLPVSIGTATFTAPGGDCTVAHSGITAGDLVVLTVAGTDGDGIGVADVSVPGEYFSNAVAGIWYLTAASNHAAGDIAVTFDDYSVGNWAFSVLRATGIAASPLDKTATATGIGTTPSSGATATLSQADELVIGVVSTQGPVADSAGTWQLGLTAINRVGVGSGISGATVSDAYAITTTTAAVEAHKHSITSRNWTASVATFKGA